MDNTVDSSLKLDLNFLGISHNWQLGFQIPGSPIMDGIVGLHNLLMVYLVFIVIFVTVMLVAACILFNENNVNRVLNIRHSSAIEASSTLSAVFILFLMASVSFSLLYSADEIMDSDITLKVIGRQWYWTYEQTLKNPVKYYMDVLNNYKNFDSVVETLKNEVDFKNLSEDFYMMSDEEILNRKTQILNIFTKILNKSDLNNIYIPEDRLLRTVGTYSDSLILPIRTHIRFLITSEDVIHSWAIPSLGIKMDAVPGRLNQLFTYIPYEGIYYGQCSELCGTNHGFMPIAIKAVTYNSFLKHYSQIFFIKSV